MSLEKIIGGGGEGFWKNAKASPVLEVDKEASLEAMAQAMGISADEIADRMNDQVEDWQKGFDKLLMIQGMQAKTLGIKLPSPEHFFNSAVQSFASSMSIPFKILVGMQTGERASTEDAEEWAQTNNGRRENIARPCLRTFVGRLVRFRTLPVKDWYLDWSDLTEASMKERVDRVAKMAGVNATSPLEWIFHPEELRAVAEYEPLAEGKRKREQPAPNNTPNPGAGS